MSSTSFAEVFSLISIDEMIPWARHIWITFGTIGHWAILMIVIQLSLSVFDEYTLSER